MRELDFVNRFPFMFSLGFVLLSGNGYERSTLKLILNMVT